MKPNTAPTGSPRGLAISGRAWNTWWISEWASITHTVLPARLSGTSPWPARLPFRAKTGQLTSVGCARPFAPGCTQAGHPPEARARESNPLPRLRSRASVISMPIVSSLTVGGIPSVNSARQRRLHTRGAICH